MVVAPSGTALVPRYAPALPRATTTTGGSA